MLVRLYNARMLTRAKREGRESVWRERAGETLPHHAKEFTGDHTPKNRRLDIEARHELFATVDTELGGTELGHGALVPYGAMTCNG